MSGFVSNFADGNGEFKSINGNSAPTVNFNFMLVVDAVWDVPLKSVHVIRKENEYDYIQEGGLNDYVHMIRKPITKPFTLQIERYVGADFYDPLSLGTQLALPISLSVGRYLKPGMFLPDRQYIFTGCEVTAKDYGELGAEKSGLLTETTTIAFETMYAIDSPLTNIKEPWKFDGKKVEGNGNASRNTERVKDDPSLATMISRTQRWSMAKEHGGYETRKDDSVSSRQNLLIDADIDPSKQDIVDNKHSCNFPKKGEAYSGTGKSSRKQGLTNDPSKKDMIGKDKAWNFPKKGESYAGTGTSSRMKGKTIDPSKQEMIDKDKAWNFPKKGESYTGTGESSRKQGLTNDPSKQDMIDKDKVWNFPKKGESYTGTGESSRKQGLTNDPSKQDMIAKDKAWKYPQKGESYTGTGTSSRKQGLTNDPSKQEMIDNKRLWPEKKSAQTIADFLSGKK